MEEKKQVKLNLTVLVLGTLVVLALGIAIGQLLAVTKENVENSIMKENENTSSEINKNTVIEEDANSENQNEVIVNKTEINKTEIVEENTEVEENTKTEGNEKKQEQSTDKEQNVENTVKEINVDSKKVQNLYSYIEKLNYYEEELVYKTNKVELKDVSNQLKLLTVFSNLTEDDATEDYLYYSDIYPEGNQHLIYSKEVVENKAKEIYGPNVKIIHENASPYDSYTIEYVNGSYECYSYEGGGDVPWSMSYSAMLKAEEANNKLYIYDRYVHLVAVEDIIDGINHYGCFDVFSATDRKEKLATKLNLEDLGYYENISQGFTENQENNILLDRIDSYIDGGIKTFKHTFEKDKNGNYYWVSTEPIEE